MYGGKLVRTPKNEEGVEQVPEVSWQLVPKGREEREKGLKEGRGRTPHRGDGDTIATGKRESERKSGGREGGQKVHRRRRIFSLFSTLTPSLLYVNLLEACTKIARGKRRVERRRAFIFFFPYSSTSFSKIVPKEI